jgi:hypothetical protein
MSRTLVFLAWAAVAGCGVLIDDPEGYCRGTAENYSVAWSMVGQSANVVVTSTASPLTRNPAATGTRN